MAWRGSEVCGVDIKTKLFPALRINPVLQLSTAKPEYINHLVCHPYLDSLDGC